MTPCSLYLVIDITIKSYLGLVAMPKSKLNNRQYIATVIETVAIGPNTTMGILSGLLLQPASRFQRLQPRPTIYTLPKLQQDNFEQILLPEWRIDTAR
jgi:hypothetical protein